MTDGRAVYRTRGGAWEETAGQPAVELDNGRTTWGRWVDLACPAGDILWARATFGKGAGTELWGVYRSTDGGATWALVGGRAKGNHASAVSGPWAVVDADTVLVAGTSADLLGFEGTFDGGVTWSGALYDEETHAILPPGNGKADRLRGWPRDLSFSDPQHGWVLNGLPAPGWDLLRTADGGRSWQPVALPPMTGAAEPGD